jgi:hypothetical protein
LVGEQGRATPIQVGFDQEKRLAKNWIRFSRKVRKKMPIEIVIAIVAGCAVAIFSGVGKADWNIFKKEKDSKDE